MTEPLVEVGVRVTTADGRSTSLIASNMQLAATGSDDGPSALTRAEAAELTARITNSLDHAEVLIAQAYLRRAWEPLGLPSWNAYVEAHFGDRPLLTVPRQDRREVVRSLSESGLPGRAIARAIGVSEGTVRNDLSEDGAQNCAPEDAADDLVEVLCPTCGESHPADVGTCPYLDDAFGTIIDLDANANPDRRFGPGPSAGGGSDVAEDRESEPDPADDIDSENDPLPEEDPAPGRDAEASRRARRIRNAIERIAVLRDDLDELDGLLRGMDRDLGDWPEGASTTPPADLAERLRVQVAAIRLVLPDLPGRLASAEHLSAVLEGTRR
ncbi:helix-turn-helix domain-containing protein [Nakamurella lactea]|uniref:hypothetical protein n=1 Tax=Nakamurella lactea TaxID=459515 RepID=UPI0003FBFB17|nr:hypothetical protein [Nakamurella lactea]